MRFSTVPKNRNKAEKRSSDKNKMSQGLTSGLTRFFGARSAKAGLSERIAARVEERNSWSTWHNHTPTELLKFMATYKPSLPRMPSQKELELEFPVLPLKWDVLRSNQTEKKLAVTWIGHATCLLQISGFNVLTDPVFSKRCAPTQFAGPARYRPTPCSVAQLVERLNLDVVVVSHNHYDHLDYQSIKDLAQCAKNSLVFVVPLGLREWFETNISNVQERHTVVELDWHESHSIVAPPSSSSSNEETSDNADGKNSLEIIALPMQHWTSRSGFDKDATLWCGFSMKSTSDNKKALFAGDTGWFEQAHDIGERYGPFDVAMIPIGAYEPYEFMRPQHNNPNDAVKMMQAVKASRAVPIHWGTFQLTKEHYLEPRERLEASLKAAGVPPERFGSWLIGETVMIQDEA